MRDFQETPVDRVRFFEKDKSERVLEVGKPIPESLNDGKYEHPIKELNYRCWFGDEDFGGEMPPGRPTHILAKGMTEGREPFEFNIEIDSTMHNPIIPQYPKDTKSSPEMKLPDEISF